MIVGVGVKKIARRGKKETPQIGNKSILQNDVRETTHKTRSKNENGTHIR